MNLVFWAQTNFVSSVFSEQEFIEIISGVDEEKLCYKLFNKHVGPILEYLSLVCSNMNPCEKADMENFQRAFFKLLWGISPNLKLAKNNTSPCKQNL